MTYGLLAAVGLLSAAAGAQVRSVSDPNALKMDQPQVEQQQAQKPMPPEPPLAPPPAPRATSTPANPNPATLQSGGLNLVCGGGGTANKPNVGTTYGSSSASGMVGTTPITMSGSGSTTVITQRQQDYADQVDIRLFAGDDRIRLPRTLLPPIHGGSDGWFELTNVKVTNRTITASAGINFMNHPKVHIDRVTGTISINGKAGSYVGQCEVVESNAQQKF